MANHKHDVRPKCKCGNYTNLLYRSRDWVVFKCADTICGRRQAIKRHDTTTPNPVLPFEATGGALLRQEIGA